MVLLHHPDQARWPDGSKDPWSRPADSKLLSLLLFISFNEIVTKLSQEAGEHAGHRPDAEESGTVPPGRLSVQIKNF